VATPTGTLRLSEVRQVLAETLAPADPGDPQVLADLVDAVEPPVLLLEWADPWITERTIGGLGGWFDAHMDVRAIAGRLEPGPGIETLEGLMAYTLARIAGVPALGKVESTTAPRRFDIAGLTYLGARVSLLVPVSIE